MTLEEQYNIDIKGTYALYPPGSEERAEAKKELWKRFQANKFLRDGDPGIIHRLQKIFAVDLHNLIVAFYSGKLAAEDYGPRRSSAFLDYATRCVEYGLATEVPNDAWVASFTANALAFEGSLISPKTTGITVGEALSLCIPLRDKCKDIIFAFHVEFGVKRLKDNPHVYAGILRELEEEELELIRQNSPALNTLSPTFDHKW